MTSTQTRRAREGVDVPSRFAAIDAVKGQPEIAQSDVDDAGDARTATGGVRERTAAAPSPGHLARRGRWRAQCPALATGRWSARITAPSAGTGNRGGYR